MAVTATGNAEQLAVATLYAYDFYRPYINPKATGPQIVKVTRIVVCIYAFVSGGVACILMKLGLSLGWVYLFMGIIIGSAPPCFPCKHGHHAAWAPKSPPAAAAAASMNPTPHRRPCRWPCRRPRPCL